MPLNNRQKVLVAMSGGVDSSVAAALLKEQGYDLIGVTMNVWPSNSESGCCGISASEDAKKVCAMLDVPHYTLNFRDVFKTKVIDDFIEEYKNGRTHNPCVRCNQYIKFQELMWKARELGAGLVATGHYARISEGRLFKGRDKRKDQAYVLYMMNQESLSHTLFPIGEMTKDEVREKAKQLGLPVHDKEESQEICFVEDDDYVRFLKEKCPEAVKPGPILDTSGEIVGQHEGIAFYTIGQRKGIGSHRDLPKYVVQIDRARNAVVIGDQKDTLSVELVADQVSYVSGKAPMEPLNIAAKIRYNSKEAEATLYPEGKVVFKNPQRSITPGQSVVFYKGEEVIGGGIIS